jgi:pilus assembly protein CpaB
MFTGRTLFLLIFALLLAFGAVIIAQRWVDSMAGGPAPVKMEYTKIVIAALEIPQWQPIDAAKLKQVDWPTDAVTSDMFRDISEVVTKVAIETIYPGEPVNRHRVTDPKLGNVFSMQIPKSMRAFTVRINDVTGVGGFLAADSHVDVISSKKKTGPIENLAAAVSPNATAQAEQTYTETIIQNVRVLAVDQDASKDKGKPTVGRSVTLEMSPAQAEIMFKAVEEGSIQLALRNPTDDAFLLKKTPERIVPIKPTSPIIKAPQPPPPKAVAAPPKVRTFTIMRGMSSSKVICNPSDCLE